jgi:DNA-binding transcriptional regulator YiaG
VLALKLDGNLPKLNAVAAVLSLCRHGMTMLRAKRAVEHLIEAGEATVSIPSVADAEAFARELAESGIGAAAVAARDVDVRTLRENLRLTQEQFALQFGFEIDAVRNWEHGRRSPDKAARSYLRVIERMPEAARKAQEDMLVPPPT